MTVLTTTTVAPIVQGEAIRTVAPTAMAVDIDAALEHARLGSSPMDFGSVLAMLAAATEAVENYTGLGLIAQTWTQSFSAWPSVLTLQRRPLLALGSPAQAVSIAYLDSDGVSAPLASTEYAVTGIGGEKVPGTVRLIGTAWPGAFAHPEAVTVTYTVGFGTTSDSVPALIKQAILLTFGSFYEFRADVTDLRVMELPFASKALLRPWRPLAVA